MVSRTGRNLGYCTRRISWTMAFCERGRKSITCHLARSTFDIGIDIRSYYSVKIAFDFSCGILVSIVRDFENYSGNRMYLRERCLFGIASGYTSDDLPSFQRQPPLDSQVRPQFTRSAFLRAVLWSRESKDVDSGRNTNFWCTRYSAWQLQLHNIQRGLRCPAEYRYQFAGALNRSHYFDS